MREAAGERADPGGFGGVQSLQNGEDNNIIDYINTLKQYGH